VVGKKTLPTLPGWNKQEGKYGEPPGRQIFGIEADNQVLPTQPHTWKIDFASNPKEPSEANKFIQVQKHNGLFLLSVNPFKIPQAL